MSVAIPVITAAGLSTFDELIAEIPLQMNRSDYGPRVPTFMALCEAEMNRRLALSPVLPMHTRATLPLTAEYVQAPPRILDFDEIEVPNYWVVKPSSPQNIAAMKANGDYAGQDGPPRFYARIGSQIRLYPAPATSYIASVVYWQKLAPLSATNQANWVLADHPDAYFHGILAYGYEAEKDQENRDHHMTLFDTVMDRVLKAYPTRTDMTPMRSEVGALMRACLA